MSGPIADGEEVIWGGRSFIDFLLRQLPIFFLTPDPVFFWEQVFENPIMKSRSHLHRENSRLHSAVPNGSEDWIEFFFPCFYCQHPCSFRLLRVFTAFLQLVSRSAGCGVRHFQTSQTPIADQSVNHSQAANALYGSKPPSHCLTNKLQPLYLCTQGPLPPFMELTVPPDQTVPALQAYSQLGSASLLYAQTIE